jgi:hypothetical protein
LSFSATLGLDSYDLPGNALVYVEAYRKGAWTRFPYGTVRSLSAPNLPDLSEFGSHQGLLFRVKVVAPPDAGAAAKLLAVADHIQPRRPEEEREDSLLPVLPADLGGEVWKLDIDDDGAILKVDRNLVPNPRSFVTDPTFVALVLPEVFRRILDWILQNTQVDDDQRWGARWLVFAKSLPGVGDLPGPSDQPDDFVESAVTSFCRRFDIHRHFRNAEIIEDYV